MTTCRHLVLALALGATLVAAAKAASGRQGSVQAPGDAQATGAALAGHAGHDMSSMPGMQGTEGAGAADGAMDHEHMDMGPHMKMTAPRPRSAADLGRADAIVQTLRGAIGRYRDVKAAEADGFVEYLPNLKQRIYHFTNWTNALAAHSRFDPARPTSLLYKPTAGGGFELVGAMYTAPRGFDEAQLDERVPLSVASWHEHVNICLPPKSAYATSDWRRFGFAGSIATAADCAASGGVFHPVIFGWMVHVYPFEQDPARIWAH
ncbi:MAG TPA: hypothetical protein VMW75_21525 [Thermoanaerobaculia bacterium]|nr:hypothetical protein [Thermoanaerobaculia bacterium]